MLSHLQFNKMTNLFSRAFPLKVGGVGKVSLWKCSFFYLQYLSRFTLVYWALYYGKIETLTSQFLDLYTLRVFLNN